MKKIFFFDCDQTIWTSGNNDYISNVVSPLVLVSKNFIIRIKDGNIFTLKSEILEVFKHVNNAGNTVGIISDNRKNMVINALKLFNIYQFVNLNAVNIRLWKGYCPKHKMIEEILSKPEFKSVLPKNVYWFDDKDYSNESNSIGVNFIRVDNNTNFKKIVKKLLA